MVSVERQFMMATNIRTAVLIPETYFGIYWTLQISSSLLTSYDYGENIDLPRYKTHM
jgi:hypothetical protein